MSNVCIITDSTVQFTQSNFPGHEHVHVIPFDIQAIPCQKSDLLPDSVRAKKRLISPSPQEFIKTYTRLSREYDSILILTLSSLLDPTMSHAILASAQFNNGAIVDVIDSQTVAIGLGMLVQLAAGAASKGAGLREVDRRVRANIPRVYMLFCTPELAYLACSGLIDHAQALAAEMMGMLPIFNMEDGRFVPLEKVRSQRHLFEAFEDFMGEFENPSHIAIVSSLERSSLRKSQFRHFIKDRFPDTSFSDHPIQPLLASLLGPSSIGLAVMDSVE